MSNDLMPHGKLPKSSTGLDANLAALLSYLVGVVSGLIFYLLEKESKFVRFHALQSILVSISLMVLNVGVSFIPYLGGFASLILSLLGFGLWVFLMVKAFKGEFYKVPVIGEYVEKQIFEE